MDATLTAKGFMGARRHVLRLRQGCLGLGLEGLLAGLFKELDLGGHLHIGPDGYTLALLGRAVDLQKFQLWWRERCPYPWAREWELASQEDLGPEDLAQTGELLIGAQPGGVTGGAALPCPPDLGLDWDVARHLLDEGHPRQAYAPLLTPHGGPRYSLMTALPLMRLNTTLWNQSRPCDCALDPMEGLEGGFPLARDFSTCVRCGPPWWMSVPPDPTRLRPDFEHLALAISSGGVVAAKGIGGFYWLGDATSGGVISRLREFKNNPFRPFVVLYATLEMAAADFVIPDEESALLKSPRRPAVKLFPRAQETGRFGWAQGFDCRLAVRLAATPFEFLLSRVSGRPLAVTSANDPGHGIGLAAAEVPDHHGQHALVDDPLPIHNPVEDSVVQHLPGHGVQVLVRSRGFVPLPLPLPAPLPQPVLALGDGRTGVLALGAGAEVTLSPPLGDLRQPGPSARAARWLSRLLDWTGVFPGLIVMDDTPAEWERPLLQVFADFPQRRVARAVALAHGLMAQEGYQGEGATVFVWDTEVDGPDGGCVLHGGPRQLTPLAALLMQGEIVSMGQVMRRMAAALELDSLCGPQPSYPNEAMDLLYGEGMKAIGGPTGLVVPQWMAREDGLVLLAMDEMLQDLAAHKAAGVSGARLALTAHWVLTIAGCALLEWLEKEKPVDFVGGAGSLFGNSLILDGFDGELVSPIRTPLHHPPSGGGLAYGQVAACVFGEGALNQ